MKEWYSAAELAKGQLPEIPSTERAIQIRAEREGWTKRRRQGRGGGWEYSVTSVPDPARAVLAARDAGAGVTLTTPRDDNYRPTAAEVYQRAKMDLSPEKQLRMDAKLEILGAMERLRNSHRLGKVAARKTFSMLFNARSAEVPSWVYEVKDHVCANTLESWENEKSAGSLRNLAGRYGQRKDTGILSVHKPLNALLIGFLATFPHASAKQARDFARSRVGDAVEVADKATGEVKSKPLPCLRSFERFLAEWKDQNKALFTLATNPDKFKSKYQYAPGEMYTHVNRRNQLWEIDASPSDVMCLDGRYSIYVVIDIFTRWPRARVTKTPRAVAALLLMRDCIVGWPGKPDTAMGVPEELKTDNGSDFVAYHFKDAVSRLGIEQSLCKPYSPNEKAAVERVIGTIQHGFMELQPGYIGHDVADRKAIEARRTFADRLGCPDQDAFCVELTATELQDRLNDWIETVYVHEKHDGLDGRTPFEVRQSFRGRISRIEGEGALEHLLAVPADNKGSRTVTKKGVSVNSIDYYHPGLMPGERVHVRLDPDDVGRVYVYRGDPWQFVGIAVNPERAGLSRAKVAAEIKTAQKATLKEGMAEIKRKQKGINVKSVSAEMIDAARRRNNVVPLPAAHDPYTTPDLDAAAKAARVSRGSVPEAKPVSAEEQARLAALETELQGGKVKPLPVRQTAPRGRAAPMQKEPLEKVFGRALELERRLASGGTATEGELQWLEGFRHTPDYRAGKGMYEDFGDAWLNGTR